jgi:glycosyltransferase involved in cell wall biosynthesis
MRILVDGYWWYEGPQSNRMVMREIVRQWTVDFPEDKLIVAAPSRHRKKFGPLPSPGVKNIDTHLPLQPLINTFELPVIARRESADGVLAFNFASPSKRGVVYIVDVLFQSNPEWFTVPERVYFAGMPLLAPRAKSVITISDSERQRIADHNPKLTRVVSSGLTLASSLTQVESTKKVDLAVTRGSFVVCVGRFNVRKNLDTTLRALLNSGVLSPEFPLVLVGEVAGAPADISKEMAAAPKGSILVVNRLTEGELRWLYENCRFAVSLSLDEGFGLPGVEAAYFGAPVLASDISVFHETLGDCGIFVDPMDVGAISAAAQRIVDSPAYRVSHSQKHSWSSICHCVRSELVR